MRVFVHQQRDILLFPLSFTLTILCDSNPFVQLLRNVSIKGDAADHLTKTGR